jgi:hypothetical protein
MSKKTMKMGIEQEFVFTDQAGRYLDLENSDYSLFMKIIDEFPLFAGDDEVFDCKSLEQQPKRCYVEGLEQYGADGKLIQTLPKALEIRTMPHASVEGVVGEFQSTYRQVMPIAKRYGLSPVLTSKHPFKTSFSSNLLAVPMGHAIRTKEESNIAFVSMLTHGLHVNVSISDYSYEQMEDLVHKINYYMPSFIPYSFSSPFLGGREFEGLCSRSYSRSGARQLAGLSVRQGVAVLEFRGFDACGDGLLLSVLLNLFRGFLLDDILTGRAQNQDPECVKRSSMCGFDDPSIRKQGRAVLSAARNALEEDASKLDHLEAMLENNDSFASTMKRCNLETGDIMSCISSRYNF